MALKWKNLTALQPTNYYNVASMFKELIINVNMKAVIFKEIYYLKKQNKKFFRK